MKNNIFKAGWLLSILSSLFYCTGEQDDYTTSPNPKALSINEGDTLIYFRDSDYVTLPFGKGNYNSPWCDTCLFMDKYYGRIDLKKSESGIYFPVTYSNDWQKITVNVAISGVRYRDGIYYLRNGEKFLKPYYNARNNFAPQGSYFDVPPSGWPSLTSQGVAIDEHTGIIDLERTIQNGALQGQDRMTFRMYYRINDASHFALNHTDITIILSPTTGGPKAASYGRSAVETITSDERCRTGAVVVK